MKKKYIHIPSDDRDTKENDIDFGELLKQKYKLESTDKLDYKEIVNMVSVIRDAQNEQNYDFFGKQILDRIIKKIEQEFGEANNFKFLDEAIKMLPENLKKIILDPIKINFKKYMRLSQCLGTATSENTSKQVSTAGIDSNGNITLGGDKNSLDLMKLDPYRILADLASQKFSFPVNRFYHEFTHSDLQNIPKIERIKRIKFFFEQLFIYSLMTVCTVKTPGGLGFIAGLALQQFHKKNITH